MSPSRVSLHQLVACRQCQRQYDASGLAARARFHCRCGATLEVPRAAPREAAVVRCSSCGAPRPAGAARCTHCRAPFTGAEVERNTLCPSCLARIADRSRYCAACGLRIDPQEIAGAASERACPACAPERRLTSRPLAEPAGSFLECGGCGGVWLGNELFRELEGRAHREASALPAAAGKAAAAPVGRAPAAAAATAIVYRPCPVCSTRMHRRNYGERSGILLDVCARHGVWFDAHELERVLDWIRSGAADRARRLGVERLAEEARRARALRDAAPGPFELEPPRRGAGGWGFVRDLVEWLLGRVA